MTTADSLSKRINRMLAAIEMQNKPLYIDCTGAKEDLLAMLEQQIEASGEDQDQDGEPVILPALFEELDAALEQSVKDIERCYNVRFVHAD